jgi:serine/threonine protein kinase
MDDQKHPYSINDDNKDIEYCSPEIFSTSKFKYESERHFSVDYWALGIVIYKCLTGQFPFLSIISLVEDEIPDLNEFNLSDETTQLISSLLNKNRDERLTLKQIKEHQFFKDIDWLMLKKGEVEPPIKPFVVIIIIYLVIN